LCNKFKEFNLKYFGKISERMLEAKRKIDEAQCRM